MKVSKKIVTLFLISALTLSNTVSAFADGEEKTTESVTEYVCSETADDTITQKVESVKMKSVAYMTVGSVTEMSSTLTVSPETATNKEMVWESSNKEIAVVDELGCVQAVKTGRCVITARSKENSDKKASCSVIISQNVEAVSVSSKNMVLDNGETAKLTATVTPADASAKCVVWSSSNKNVAVVSATGVVTATGAGNCVIKATSTDGTEKYGYCSVTVTQKATDLAFINAPETIGIGEKRTLNTVITPSYATAKLIKYTSSNNAVATVSARGVVSAVGKGKCKITAVTTDGSNISASFNLNVIQNVENISLDSETKDIRENTSVKLKTTVTPTNATIKKVTYLSSNTNVASVSADGVILGKNKGSCKIYVTSNDGSAVRKYCTVNVVRSVENIALEEKEISLNTEDTFALKYNVSPVSASVQSVTYKSSNPEVAVVDTNGIVTAVGRGTCEIKCISDDNKEIYDVCKVTVKQPVKGIKVIGDDTMKEGETRILTATISPVNVNNSKIVWSSSDKKVATVDSKGNVKALSAGKVTIKCTSDENSKISVSHTITVKAVKTKGEKMADYAAQWVGVTPYVWGGTSLKYGADCSGFVCSIYEKFGYNLWYARTNLDMVGRAVSLSEAKPGDIVLFPGHVALYVGNGYITHAMNESLGVRTTPVSWGGYVRCVRRVID